MATMTIFNGVEDVVKWAAVLKAKLIAKGYRSHLQDINRPNGIDAAGIAAAAIWDGNRDKALGMVMSAIDPDIMGLYVAMVTPETLIAAVVNQYRPNANQEIERLEREFKELTYNGIDSPLTWVAKLRNLIGKLTAANAAPSDRAIKSAVWDALEAVYGVRVEIMRHSTPNMTIAELWAAITTLPYPIKGTDNAFTTFNQTSNREIDGYYNSRSWNTSVFSKRGNYKGGRGQPQGPPRYLQQEQLQEREYQKAKGLCYICSGDDHPYYKCYQYRQPPRSGDKDSDKDINKDKSENEEKDRKNPHAYAFFSQKEEESSKEKPPQGKNSKAKASSQNYSMIAIEMATLGKKDKLSGKKDIIKAQSKLEIPCESQLEVENNTLKFENKELKELIKNMKFINKRNSKAILKEKAELDSLYFLDL